MVATMLFLLVFTALASVSERFSYDDDAQAYRAAIAAGKALAFLSTPGEPSNWSRASFNRPGLVVAEGKAALDEGKLTELLTANYSLVLGSLGSPFELFINASGSGGALRPGGLGRIAYTQAGNELWEGDAAAAGWRNYLAVEGVNFTVFNATGGLQDFLDAAVRLDSFDALVVEDAHVNFDQLNASVQQSLRAWVAAGGTFVQKEHGTVIELFNATATSVASGTVVSTRFLRNATSGDSVSCAEAASVRNTSDADSFEPLVSNGADAVFATWSYGSGRVLFACDSQGSLSGSIELDNLTAATAFFGVKALYGSVPANASVAAVLRKVMLFKGNYSVLEVTAWR